MKALNINIIITIAAILVSYGITAFFPSTKTKFIVFGVGATVIFWVWLLSYANHKTLQESKNLNETPEKNSAISSNHESKSNDKTIKFPDHKFTETPEEVTISFASISGSYKAERLINEKVSPIIVPGVKIFAYIENNVLYADSEFYGGQGHTINISKNTLSGLPPKWDYNSTNKALEIVNENKVPIYQLIYKTPNHILINGVFQSNAGLVLADEDGMLMNPALPIPLKIKRIFKYPSYQHQGEYEE